jgi:hypothetical protein
MEYEGNRPIRVLLPEQLESYSLTGNGDFPRLSKAEIEDKSKGDAISKGVVILQTGWFVTQCIARGVQGLPITELELATVAFAALNFVIYLLWWDKPQNVQRGVRVYKKRRVLAGMKKALNLPGWSRSRCKGLFKHSLICPRRPRGHDTSHR